MLKGYYFITLIILKSYSMGTRIDKMDSPVSSSNWRVIPVVSNLLSVSSLPSRPLRVLKLQPAFLNCMLNWIVCFSSLMCTRHSVAPERMMLLIPSLNKRKASCRRFIFRCNDSTFGSTDKSIRVWNVNENRCLNKIDTGSQVCNMMYSINSN